MAGKNVRTRWRWGFHPVKEQESPARDAPRTVAEHESEDVMDTMRRAIAEFGPPRSEMPRSGLPRGEEAFQADLDKPPLVRLMDAILVHALREGASDLHIEPDPRSLRLRLRVDGLLRKVMPIPPHFHSALIGRCKVLSGMDAARGRVPGEGRLAVRLEDRIYDLRLSCFPTLYGESVVVHIPDPSRVRLGLHRLGITPQIQVWVEDLALRPGGLFLIAGPNGCGKTTTLYSLLYKLNSVERKIFTVEESIEYRLDGVMQVELDARSGLRLGDALRAIARQDPDVLAVSDLRDAETAGRTVQAALAGRLVLSTLNAGDALGAISRLIEMGIDPQTLSQTVTGILAQRLVRRICPECKEPYTNETRTLPGFEFDFPGEDFAGRMLFRGRGCAACGNTGYKGRIGIYELLRVDGQIAEQIVRRGSPEEFRYLARVNGLRDLRADGLQKVWEGITTPDALLRATGPARGYVPRPVV